MVVYHLYSSTRKVESQLVSGNKLNITQLKGLLVDCTLEPNAPHLKENLKNGQKRVWVEVELKDIEYYDRPESQGGTWILAQQMKITKEL
jgi:hypothetical protein